MIHCEATGLVYANPKPYLKAIHAWHPSVLHLGGTELLCAFDLGEAAESLDYRTYVARSSDGGKSWGSPQRLLLEPAGRRSTHTARLMMRRDGVLMAFGARFYRDNPDEGLTNRATLGFVPMELLLMESRDLGSSWLPPRVLTPPLEGPAFEVCHALVELRDGRLLAPTQTWPGWDGRAPNGWRAVAFVSSDGGETWPEYVTVFEDRQSGAIHFEQSVVQLPDGRLLAVAWAFDAQNQKTLPTPYSISADGRTFSAPMPTGLCAETAKLQVLGDGRLLCVYRRVDKPGLWAQVARIEGDRWINLAEQPLWTGPPLRHGPSETASDHLSSLKFGYPSMITLPDASVMLVFWCEENGVHAIRWLRLIADPATPLRPHFNTQRDLEDARATGGRTP